MVSLQWRLWIIAGAIFLVTVATFSGAFFNDFVNYDDDVYVYANPSIAHGITLPGVVRAFSQPHARNWHPLTTISHMVDCQIFGLNPSGPHVINVLLHALSAAGLFFALQAMTGSTWRACFVAAVFAIHPLGVESVAWIAERKDVLSALLFVCTLVAYSRYTREPDANKKLVLTAFFACALMAKPMVVTLPVVLLFLDFWPLARLSLIADKKRDSLISFSRAISEKIPLFILSLASCTATIFAARSGNRVLDSIPLGDRLANAAISYCTYIYQLFWPDRLAVFYPLPLESPPLTVSAAATIVIVSITITTIVLRNRLPYLFVGWFWYLVMLLPVIGIWQIGLQAHADRYTYLPGIGLLIGIAWATVALLRRFRALPFAAPIAVCVLALLAWRTWTQVEFWRSSESLWTHALAVTTDNDVALNNLGSVYENRGDFDRARANYQTALDVLNRRPNSRYQLSRALVHNNLGNLFLREQDGPAARNEYEQAIALQPDYGNAHVNLGQLFAQEGDWTSALAEYETVLRLQPHDADAQYRAGVALMRLGRADDAVVHYRDALAAQPDFALAELDLGNATLERGHTDEAITHYRRALQIDPQNVDAHFNLGRVYLQQRRLADAISEYQRVISIQPNDPEAHLSLGNAFAAAASESRAITEIEKALELAPNSVSALNNLAWLLATASESNLRNPTRAIMLAEKAQELLPRPNALVYHTLASAYASAGRFDDAIAAAEHAQNVAEEDGDTALADAVKKELERYRKSSQD
jgi:protein O-mannosyl-transferase